MKIRLKANYPKCDKCKLDDVILFPIYLKTTSDTLLELNFCLTCFNKFKNLEAREFKTRLLK